MELSLPVADRPGQRARAVIVLSILLTGVLWVVPYGRLIGYPLLLLSTLAHEMGHGLAGVLVGANFESFVMYADASGVARLSGSVGRVSSGIISAGGLVGPAILGAVFFMGSARPKLSRAFLVLFGVGMLVACALVVRNPFGLAFVAGVGLVCALVGWKAPMRVSQALLAFLGAQLALSVFSRGDYLFTDMAQTAEGASPSDVAQMSQALFLPYWFWGGICGLFSVVVLGGGLWVFWRATKPPPALSL